MAMHPRNRLWTELIFPRCELGTLLALRAVCRAFLAQLNAAPARVWQPVLAEVSRMGYAEGLLGWPGVELAMVRERKTRENCTAGHFALGPVLSIGHHNHLLIAGGNMVVFVLDEIRIYNGETGAQLAVLSIGAATLFADVLSDRWVPVMTYDEGCFLVDCVAMRLVRVPLEAESIIVLSVCGASILVRLRTALARELVVMHVSSGPEGTTTVHTVARITDDADLRITNIDDSTLCERGQSLVSCEGETVKLVDVATVTIKRVYTMRTCRNVVAAPVLTCAANSGGTLGG